MEGSASARRATIRLRRSSRAYLRAFWYRAYRENVTGLSGMVAYNMLLALFPFALLVLFVFGQILQSPEAQESVVNDMVRVFPAVEQETITRLVNQVRDSSTTIGIAAAVGALWIGASFWGAMDTAFCRIYHVECRGWVEQKRFAFAMLLVSTLFLASTVAIPAIEALIASSADDLPFGLSEIDGLANFFLLIGALVLVFIIGCAMFYFVPKGHMPWRGVWPGALFLAVTMGLANWLFPFYLVELSSLSEFAGTVGFVLVALLWFYVLSLIILSGAVINALRHELHDTGTLEEGWRL